MNPIESFEQTAVLLERAKVMLTLITDAIEDEAHIAAGDRCLADPLADRICNVYTFALDGILHLLGEALDSANAGIESHYSSIKAARDNLSAVS